MLTIQNPTNVSGRILVRLCQICMIVAVALLAFVAVLVVVQVIARNIFDLGLPWADELARFSSMGLVYLSIPLIAVNRQHVSVDFLPQLAGPRWRIVLDAVTEIGIAVFCGITLYGMQSYLIRAGKFSTPAIGISNWVFYTPASIGITLFLLVSVFRLFGQFTDNETESAS
jgi:TRAP-type transport system small permease protein